MVLLVGGLSPFISISAEGVTRIPLKRGLISIPATADFTDGRYHLVLHLHGARKVMESNLAATHPKAVWANLTLPGLSSVYRRHFQDSNVFASLLEEIERTLTTTVPERNLHRHHLTLSSFSAGFGGVRELLKQPENRSQIHTLVMADSLYAGFIGKPENRTLNPDHLNPFLAFARLAIKGERTMVLSHTQLHTPSYASTKETADYLIQHLGGRRQTSHKEHPGGLTERDRCSLGKFTVIGFDGLTGDDHMKHLRQIQLFFKEAKAMNLTQ